MLNSLPRRHHARLCGESGEEVAHRAKEILGEVSGRAFSALSEYLKNGLRGSKCRAGAGVRAELAHTMQYIAQLCVCLLS